MKPIFVGKKGSGFGYHVYPQEGSLVTETPQIETVWQITCQNGKWKPQEEVGYYELPAEARQMVEQELAKRAAAALSLNRRVCHTNGGWNASQNYGTTATVYNRGKLYVVVAVDWSRYEGEHRNAREVSRHDSLASAREAAERECITRPSFGDPEWY